MKPIVCLIVGILFCIHVYGCSCVGETSFKKEFKRSDVVFTGKVMDRKIIEIKDSLMSAMTIQKAEYTVQVTMWYKGKRKEEEITITTGIGGGDCGFEFIVGSEYIIYSSYDDKYAEKSSRVSGLLYTDICRRTRLADDEAEMKALNRKQTLQANGRDHFPIFHRPSTFIRAYTHIHVSKRLFDFPPPTLRKNYPHMEIIQSIQNRIYTIRGHRVMLDRDLAELYQTPTKSINLAVKRNSTRFPSDFMFQLTKEEEEEVILQEALRQKSPGSLRFQSETSNARGGTRYLPYAFTEQGVAMLSSVLHSNRAVQMNIAIMRAFVEVRRILIDQSEVKSQLHQLKERIGEHDAQLNAIYDALENLLDNEAAERKWKERPRIGFKK